MSALDLRKRYRDLFDPPRDDFVLVTVPSFRFVMVDGRGDPNTAAEYAQAVAWLYAVSYGTKFAVKADGQDYVVPPLEGLWHGEDAAGFLPERKNEWRWTMMIIVPEIATTAHIETGLAKARKKLGEAPASLRVEVYDEGLSVQIMHVGGYDAEAPIIARLHHEFLPANGLAETGPHHEIYLSDPRRVAPDRLRTILRQPVRRIEKPRP